MAEAEMSTKDQVRALMAENKSAQEIAAALNKTPATIYNHMANIRRESGDTTPRKRGRPPKLQSQGSKTEAPAAKTEAAKPAPAKATAKASTNGHDATRFPTVRAAIQAELTEARSKVAVLEKMLETV